MCLGCRARCKRRRGKITWPVGLKGVRPCFSPPPIATCTAPVPEAERPGQRTTGWRWWRPIATVPQHACDCIPCHALKGLEAPHALNRIGLRFCIHSRSLSCVMQPYQGCKGLAGIFFQRWGLPLVGPYTLDDREGRSLQVSANVVAVDHLH